jgi:hypothetical protein
MGTDFVEIQVSFRPLGIMRNDDILQAFMPAKAAF